MNTLPLPPICWWLFRIGAVSSLIFGLSTIVDSPVRGALLLCGAAVLWWAGPRLSRRECSKRGEESTGRG